MIRSEILIIKSAFLWWGMCKRGELVCASYESEEFMEVFMTAFCHENNFGKYDQFKN